MSESPSQSGNQNGGETTGEKHQIEHEDETPQSKRTKVVNVSQNDELDQAFREKQTTLSDAGFTVEDVEEDDARVEDAIKEDDETSVSEENSDSKEADVKQDQKTSRSKQKKSDTNAGDAIKPAEETDVPTSILEKGLIYFFIRGRVNIDEPTEVDDIARTYILLRPIPTDAKLGEGAIPDGGNTRLLALPKKVLPVSGQDRFMVFVEKSGANYDEIKKDFLASSDYETKTVGTRHTPAATPVGEGVYAITSTGRESHLAYMTTLPEKIEEVQKELGLKDKGSFILSTKNPESSGPANTQLPEGPAYPKEIMNEFRSLRWLPTQPKHLDYVNTQFLLIGESSGVDKALQPQKQDQKDGKDEPQEVLENLEEEDLKRMKDLGASQSEAIFKDLGARAKDYPKLQTTF